MEFSPDLAAIHGYLCADGYVIRNPPTQKHKYYYIGLRNTNGALLNDFKEKFRKVFGIEPIITTDGRCKIQSKEIYLFLTRDQTFYSALWLLPELDDACLKIWLRAYFDCDGWVELQVAKSRSVRLDSINKTGVEQIQHALRRFGIQSTVKQRKRGMFRLSICGKPDIERFQEFIGFLHPKKKERLNEAIKSYASYEWEVTDRTLTKILRERGKERKTRNQIQLLTIRKENIEKVSKLLNTHKVIHKVHGPWCSGQGCRYYSLTIKKSELSKIVR